MRVVETKDAPAAIGPYSQAMITGGLLFTSGQIPINPANGTIEAGDIKGQTEQVLKNIDAVLREAGTGPERVVKTTCFLQNMGDFAAFNAVYEQYFVNKPARSCVEVGALPKGALVEIEVIAEV